MRSRAKELYPLGEAVAVRRLPAPRPDMDVVLMRVEGELGVAVLPLLLAAVLAAALRRFPLGRIVLGAVALH